MQVKQVVKLHVLHKTNLLEHDAHKLSVGFKYKVETHATQTIFEHTMQLGYLNVHP